MIKINGDEFARFLRVQERTAYHEAGHALISHLMGCRVTRVTALAEEDVAGQRDGMAHHLPVTIRTPAECRKALCRALAGGIAERILDPTSAGGDEADRAWARALAEYHLADGTAGDEIQKAADRTLALLRRHWHAVDAIADELQSCEGELSGSEIRSLIRRTRTEPGQSQPLRPRARL